MDSQKPKVQTCVACGKKLNIDEYGRLFCPVCNKINPTKDLYEEKLFDLKDYQK